MITLLKDIQKGGVSYLKGESANFSEFDEKILISNGYAEIYKKPTNKKRKLKIETK